VVSLTLVAVPVASAIVSLFIDNVEPGVEKAASSMTDINNDQRI